MTISQIGAVSPAVNFQGKTKKREVSNPEKQLILPEKKEKSGVSTKKAALGIGTLAAIGLAIVARRGKGLTKIIDDVAKSLGDEAKVITEAAPKSAEKAGQAVQEVISAAESAEIKGGTCTLAEFFFNNAAARRTQAAAEQGVRSVEKTDDIFDFLKPFGKSEQETAKAVKSAPKAGTAAAEEIADTAAKEAEDVAKSAFTPVKDATSAEKAAMDLFGEEKTYAERTAESIFGKEEKAAEEVLHSNKSADDILNAGKKAESEAVDTTMRGKYGQDLYDPLDPRNEDEILSPYYKRKGSYGQNLDDPLDWRNKNDPASPYYENPLNNPLYDDPLNSFGSNPFDPFGSGF